MPTQLANDAIERSTYAVTAAFLDDVGAAVTPSAATWTLSDDRGVVVNSRSAVAISPLATTATIVLSGADLAIGASYNGRRRHLLIEYTYTSSLGAGLPGKDVAIFDVLDLAGVT